jgi:hypothetical protein
MGNNATFTIAPDGKSITCLRCGRTSWHPKDVEQHYCASCHIFHDDVLPMFTVYHDTKDFPGKWLVRRFLIVAGRALPDKLLGVGDTLDQARALVPRGLVRLDRAVNDDPVIVETWV